MPSPLTATEPADLDLSRPGTPASDSFGDIYFSAEGGLEESREVFLGGCGLPERWRDRGRFTIAETGFGTGLNFLVAWHAWAESGATGRLHYVSIERFPLDRAQLATVLEPFQGELSRHVSALLDTWPGRVKGVHRLEFDRVTLDLWHMDAADALGEMRLSADAWFLDGFAPAKNPDMWSEANLARIAQLSAPEARLATFTVAGAVRRGLAAAGFEVERVAGFGRKRQRLEAHLPGNAEEVETPRPVIIGGGIAGASVARAFLRAGVVPTLIRRPNHAAHAASANPVALAKPRLDRQDRPESRFFLQAWLYARQIFGSDREGITHLPRSEADAERFVEICAQAPLPSDHLAYEDGELRFPTAPIIDPIVTCGDFLAGADFIVDTVTGWERTDEGWSVQTEIGATHEGTHLVFASGLHVKSAFPELGLRASRGQLSWAKTDVDTPLTYGGYAVPCGDKTLLGATHDRLDGGDPHALMESDDRRNAEAFIAQTDLGVAELASCRASVRVNTANTLPLLHEKEPRLWVLTGLGSRGFSHAPLLGAALVAEILRTPHPLTRRQSARLSL